MVFIKSRQNCHKIKKDDFFKEVKMTKITFDVKNIFFFLMLFD